MQTISYELWTSISLSPQFLIISGIFFALPFIIYLLLGATVRGRSSSGKTTSNVMLSYPNYWYAVIVFDLLGLLIYIPTIIFPLWILLFE